MGNLAIQYANEFGYTAVMVFCRVSGKKRSSLSSTVKSGDVAMVVVPLALNPFGYSHASKMIGAFLR